LDCGLYGGIYLFLHRPIAGPTNCHNLFPVIIFKVIEVNLLLFKISFNRQFQDEIRGDNDRYGWGFFLPCMDTVKTL